jgi:hypothetical protein
VSRELDGALSRNERRTLLLHLSSCHDCGAFVCGQQALRAALRALAAAPLPSGLGMFSAEHKFPARGGVSLLSDPSGRGSPLSLPCSAAQGRGRRCRIVSGRRDPGSLSP